MIEDIAAGIPDALRPDFLVRWQEFEPRFSFSTDDESWLPTLPKVWTCSDFVSHACLQDSGLLRDLIKSGDLEKTYPQGELARRAREVLHGPKDEADLRKRLRVLRRREMVRLAWRDLAGWANLEEVMAVMSELADTCVEVALAWLHDETIKTSGEAVGEHSGRSVSLVVLGLGKLGGRELNFSSDIDLIFTYAEEGETNGRRRVSNHEYFLKLGRRLIAILNDATEDGFVFRVDMRLRPNGNAGPLALSFDAMEHYYQTHGRDWERYALIKARVIAGDRAGGETLLNCLRPFVYRKYLDFGAIEAIREMKEMINQELLRKGMEHNIKLGPGGIREIEFIGQAFQLVRGGREPALQIRGILGVLKMLKHNNQITPRALEELSAAYYFLRNTEHRLQMLADCQTHNLPQPEHDRLRIAFGMGYRDWPVFEAALHQHMQKVHGHFQQVFLAPQGEQPQAADQGLLAVWHDSLDRDLACSILEDAGYREADDVRMLLRGLREGTTYREFSTEGRQRMDRLMPLLLAAAGLSPGPFHTLSRLIQLLEAIGRRSAYLALLVENPVALSQLVRLCAASSWIAGWISRHPILLDELLNPAALYSPRELKEIEQEIVRRLQRVDSDDLEVQMEELREFRHGHVLRVAAADIGPGLPPEEVGRYLCAIAEVVIQQSLQLAEQALFRRFGRPICRQGAHSEVPEFAVIAYGKLGSHELGYTSDLDMIFLYGHCDAGGATDGERSVPNEIFFARLGQRLIHMLTTRTPGGVLYEVDMRLRPSGQSGPLVTNIEAFRQYQSERAWVWEHQALVRARPVAGSPELGEEFIELRREILGRPRDIETLQHEVAAMREKMMQSRTPHDVRLFDLKHDRGGIVDIEFMVQYWVLRWAHDHPGLIEYTDNRKLLEALAEAGLLDAECAQTLAGAYRCYLATEYRLKLMEQGSLVRPQDLDGYPDKVAAIWRDTFEVGAIS